MLLIAPAHTTLDYEKRGSEHLSVYLLLKELKEFGINFTAIVGEKPEYIRMPDTMIIQVGKYESLLDFHIKVQFRTFNLVSKIYSPIILHHLLPFSLYYGVNFCIALRDLCRIDGAVIGPITYPTMIQYIDEFIVTGQKPSSLVRFLSSEKNFLTKFFHKRTLYNADVILFDSKKTLNLFKNIYGNIAEHHVVYLPIDVDYIPFKPTIFEDKDHIALASIGGLRFVKRHDLFLMLVKYLRTYESMNIKGYIIGWGPLKDYMLKLIEKIGLRGIVKVKSFKRSDMIKFVAENVDIVVLFSESEGVLPTSIREAMAMGKIVVMRNVGAADEFIVNGVNGFLFNSFWEVVEVLKKLKPRDARRIAVNARRSVERLFSPRANAERLVKIYERLNPKALG